jgi:CelD/BcsL family acetyltransferase involved in cellulose biosynthesis
MYKANEFSISTPPRTWESLPSAWNADGSAAPDLATAAIVPDPHTLKEAWIDLRARAADPTLYQGYEWCAAWVDACKAAGRHEDVRIVAVWEAGRLVLLWPLAARRFGPITVLHALAEPATQYCELLVEPSPHAAAWLDVAWRMILSQRDIDVLHLRNVRADGALERSGRQRLDGCGIAANAAPFLRSGPNAEAGRRQRSGRSANALRRHLKRLKEHGPVAFETVPASGHIDALAQALLLKKQWLKARGTASAGYEHPANEATILAMASQGLFEVRQIRVGETVAAIEVGAVHKGHYYSLIQSYDARYALHAPGRLLLWQMFQESDSAIETFDFLPPSMPHKTEWTDDSVAVSSYAMACNFKGNVYIYYIKYARPKLKELYIKILASKRRYHGILSHIPSITSKWILSFCRVDSAATTKTGPEEQATASGRKR